MSICRLCEHETSFKYCIDCRSSGAARKDTYSRYSHSEKNRDNQHRWYHKDMLRTKQSKNAYNRSEKGKAAKRRWYLANKENVIRNVKLNQRLETASRTRAHELIKRLGVPRICAHCGEMDRIHVHHIDVNPFNNTFENLLLLCSTCHGKEHERLRTLASLPIAA